MCFRVAPLTVLVVGGGCRFQEEKKKKKKKGSKGTHALPVPPSAPADPVLPLRRRPGAADDVDAADRSLLDELMEVRPERLVKCGAYLSLRPPCNAAFPFPPPLPSCRCIALS
jgi:hypothetical protein